MGQDSKIEWTRHTFNPWWGCDRVSPACKHCYADTWAQRLNLDLWGPQKERRTFSDKHWAEPLKWNARAALEEVRPRVFCASMADVFEERVALDAQRARLWDLIGGTPNLDWLLLTKRPQVISKMVPWTDAWPANVWIGTTAEDQEWADKRIPHIAELPATVRFVSCEPLLGPIDLGRWLRPGGPGVNWVIAGGESGAKARPMNPLWAESLRDQCDVATVAFHFKQWGHWGPESPADRKAVQSVEVIGSAGLPVRLYKQGKKSSGRSLGGRTWDGFPMMGA
jgi:protein gp37